MNKFNPKYKAAIVKSTIVCYAILIAANVYSQDISGMGELKIGMTIEEFSVLPQIKGKSLREKIKPYESPKETEVLRTSIDTKYDEYIGATKIPTQKESIIFSPDVVRYEFRFPLGIPNILGKDDYKIVTTFFMNSLVEIYTDDATFDFKNILSEKYGKSIHADNSKMEICQNGYGAKSERMTGSVSNTWGGDGLVQAKFSFSNYSCGKLSSITYKVSNTAKVKELSKIQSEGEKKFEELQLKEKVGGSKL